MTFGMKPIDDTMCDVVLYSTTATALNILQVAETFCTMTATSVYSVANAASLPSAACNKGRFIFLDDTCGYRYSDGVSWTADFSSLPAPPLWGWGCNGNGRLGDNSATNRSSPVSVVGGFTDWSRASAGFCHSLSLRSNGTAWAWGANNFGQLGDGTSADKSSPVSVVGGFTDWCDISAGVAHSLAIRATGTAWAWGCNSGGQLGDGTSADKSSPVQVAGGFTDWCDISASFHSLGVRTNGTAWAWGCNGVGQLGDGTVVAKSSPVQVAGGFTDWCQVSAGQNHSLGVRTNGTAWAWGYNLFGHLGTNNTTNRSSPVSVVGGFTNWCQVSAGQNHSLGVRTNGTAWAWGCNGAGQLGDGTVVSKSSPVQVAGGFTNWCQVSADGHSLGVRTDGTAWAWGVNTCGRLGDGTSVDKSSPVSVVGGFTDWSQVSAGSHSLGVRPSTKGFTAL